jgi:TonB family protein
MDDAVERVLERRRREHLGRLRGAGLAGAVLLHAALAAAAFVVPRLGAEERQPIEFVSVRIIPAQALGTPQPPAPRVAAPEPEPEVEAPEPEPEPEPEEPVLPAPEPEKPAPRRPEPTPPRPTQPAPTPNRAEPAPPSEATPGSRQGSPAGSPTGTAAQGAQLAAIGDPDFTYGYYLDRVLAAIEAQWRRPPTDGVRLEVALDFRIRRDGTVAELDVAETSGLSGFDLAGLRAVQAASPLPPLPAGYRKDSLAIRLLIH